MSKLLSPVAVEFALRARAQAIRAKIHPDRVQPHSRRLPSASALEAAEFAARQFEVAADDLAAGLVEPQPGQDKERDDVA